MIKDNYKRILEEIPKNVTLVAVTKGQPINALLELYEAGCRDFAENRLIEAFSKMDNAPSDINWHFIGSLQKNKVAKVINRFSLIHSVDSFDLALKISQCSEAEGVFTSILLQVNVSGESSKHGFSKEDLLKDFEKLKALPSLKIEGLMTMAPLTDDNQVIESTFRGLRELKEKLNLNHLSMGMSHDYPIAILEGATHLRIGTALFNEI